MDSTNDDKLELHHTTHDKINAQDYLRMTAALISDSGESAETYQDQNGQHIQAKLSDTQVYDG